MSRSQHFAVGTGVILNNERWTVDRYYGRMVWLTNGTETIYVMNPYFVQWRT